MTRPAASSSGPPELPGLIAASVWMTLSIWKPSSPRIVRLVADTTPVVSVRSRPNGLPMAIVGSPTCTSLDDPSVSGRRSRPSGSTFSTARSVDGSLAEHLGVDDALVLEGDPHLARALHDVGVGQDRAVAIDHEARARGLAALLGGQTERRVLLLDDLRADEHDARRVALVDVARRERVALAVAGRLVRAQRRLLDDGGRAAALVAAAQVQQLDGADGEGRAEQRRDDHDGNEGSLHGLQDAGAG